MLRQGDHHALDLPKPHSIAAVPNVCVRPPTCAHEVFEINADPVDAIHEFSCSRHVASDACAGCESGGVQAPLDDSSCDGARMVEAERVSGQRDGSVTKDARMKPSARATGMLCASGRAHRAFRMTETRSEPTHCAVAEMRAERKRTREVVGVTRMHVEMVGTPRGVPLVRSFGASGVLCGLGTLSRRSRRAVSLFRPRRRETSRAGARRRLRREELKERHGRAMNRSVSRMRGPKLFVRASTRVARVDEVRVECSRGYVNETRPR